jgi:hypothetical protein
MLQKLAALFRQGHDGGAVRAIQRRDRSDEAGVPKSFEIAVPKIAWAALVIAEVVGRDHPERADGRQRADLRPPQGVRSIVPRSVDPLAIWTVR